MIALTLTEICFLGVGLRGSYYYYTVLFPIVYGLTWCIHGGASVLDQRRFHGKDGSKFVQLWLEKQVVYAESLRTFFNESSINLR